MFLAGGRTNEGKHADVHLDPSAEPVPIASGKQREGHDPEVVQDFLADPPGFSRL